MVATSALLQVVEAVEALAARAEARPLEYMAWLPGQLAFLSDPSKRKLARWGNQWGGKTWAGLADVIWSCLGAHPFREVPAAPIEAWVICASWSQSLALQGKLWHLLPKDALDSETAFDPGRGFRGKNPVVKFKNGSLIRIKTTQQGGLNLSSATIDYALFDEPPVSQRVFSEVQKRVLRRNGVVALTLTPINAPTEWLKELVDEGAIVDHHYRLTPANLIPVGCSRPLRLLDGTPMDEAWIERITAETPAHERPVVLDGEWEMRLQERVFIAWTDGADQVFERTIAGGELLAFGTDHGSKAGKEISLLVLLWPVDEHWGIYVLDEHCDDTGLSTPDDDARGIVQMLKRSGQGWHNLDQAWGDRLYIRGPAVRKSNKDLMAAIARQLKISDPKKLQPQIRTVKRGAGHGRGSVDAGVRFLHHAMVRGLFGVHPRCVKLREALNKWKYTEEHKDPCDALRYALDDQIFAPGKRRAA